MITLQGLSPINLLAGIAVVVVTTLGALEWIDNKYATKGELDFKYYEILIGINHIRMQNYETEGVVNLDDQEQRIYEALKSHTAELEKLRLASQ